MTLNHSVYSPSVGGRAKSLTRANPLTAYFVMAFGFAWTVEVVAFGLFDVPEVPGIVIAAFGPPVAAIVITQLTEGRDGVHTLLGRLRRWRVGLRWYALALVAVPAIGISSFVFLQDGTENLPGSPALLVLSYLLLVAVMMTMGGGQEELGWRGYALGPLQERLGAFRAAALLGLLWGLWHLPIYLLVPGYNNAGSGALAVGSAFAGFVGYTVALAMILSWVFNGTGGSVLLTMIVHGALNANFGLAPASAAAAWCITGAFAAVAMVIVLATRGHLGYGRHNVVSGPRAS